MIPEQYLQFEQEQRIASDYEAYKALINAQTEKRDNQIAAGEFDGITGLNPRFPEDEDYWSGWSHGAREYWAKKLNRTIENEF